MTSVANRHFQIQDNLMWGECKVASIYYLAYGSGSRHIPSSCALNLPEAQLDILINTLMEYKIKRRQNA